MAKQVAIHGSKPQPLPRASQKYPRGRVCAQQQAGQVLGTRGDEGAAPAGAQAGARLGLTGRRPLSRLPSPFVTRPSVARLGFHVGIS